MVKRCAAAVAVALALTAALIPPGNVPLTPLQVRRYGVARTLPLAIVEVHKDILVFDRQGNPHIRVAKSTATLVDARTGLFLTAAHVLPYELEGLLFIVGRDGRRFPARWSFRWTNIAADVAVIEAGPDSVPEGAVAPAVDARLPGIGDWLTLKGFHPPRDPSPGGPLNPPVAGFIQRYQVILPSTDGCVDRETCMAMEYLRMQERMGRTLFTAEELRMLYDRSIFAVHGGPERRGFVPGFSGSPLFNEGGAIAGVASGFLNSDPSGKHVMIAPARAARQVLDRARRDLTDGP